MAFFYNMKISSYTKGCANDLVPDFHVITETPTRPRFQCGLCSRLYEVESTGHWDGPLGGGNDLIHRGAINGWFFNHKTEFLFYESYLDPQNCRRMDDFIPVCDEYLVNLHQKADRRVGGSDEVRIRAHSAHSFA